MLYYILYYIIIARTDARGTHGLDECIKRSKAYMEAGADMIFPEGLNSKLRLYLFKLFIMKSEYY